MSARLRQIRLRDFRCFADEQAATLAPLTLLVGDNSTGKSSLLAATRAARRIAFGSGDAGFNDPPYVLGRFSEIAFSAHSREPETRSFQLGFTQVVDAKPVQVDMAFERGEGVLHPAHTSWHAGGCWLRQSMLGGRIGEVTFGIDEELFAGDPTNGVGREVFAPAVCNAIDRTLDGDERRHAFGALVAYLDSGASTREPFASAPVRANPQRTYDPTEPIADPWGSNSPDVLVELTAHHPDAMERIERFGRRAGLFDEIELAALGKWDGAPHQILVRKFGRKRRGLKRNLIDVGFGVSQILPILTETLRPDASELFLFQQPEVHLHPSAQAALGTLFCEVAASGKQLLVETHSDYLLDRIRMDVRDGETGLAPEDVSVLFFERDDLAVRIHSLRFDQNGNVLDAPLGYRQFFMDETRRSVGL